MRTLRDLGIGSVAVYSEADRNALHVEWADEAYLLGPPARRRELPAHRQDPRGRRTRRGPRPSIPATGSSPRTKRFAQAVEDAGLIWIGPPPAAMATMGDKVAARKVAIAAGVPIVAGTTEDPVDADGAKRFAKEHGYPIALKAVMGGGGKAFRVVRSADELEEALEGARARRRRTSATRRCSASGTSTIRATSRRRSSRTRTAASRSSASATARRSAATRSSSRKRRRRRWTPSSASGSAKPPSSLAKAVGYRSAGTVEFLLSPDGELSFLEMNTRLQVEHPVTELVCGVDLVAEQIRIADGQALGYEYVEPRGHAIECRINAEDPAGGLPPVTRDDHALGRAARPLDPRRRRLRRRTDDPARLRLARREAHLLRRRPRAGPARARSPRSRTSASRASRRRSHSTARSSAHEAFANGDVYTRFVEDEFLPQLPELLDELAPRERRASVGGARRRRAGRQAEARRRGRRDAGTTSRSRDRTAPARSVRSRSGRRRTPPAATTRCARRCRGRSSRCSSKQGRRSKPASSSARSRR